MQVHCTFGRGRYWHLPLEHPWQGVHAAEHLEEHNAQRPHVARSCITVLAVVGECLGRHEGHRAPLLHRGARVISHPEVHELSDPTVLADANVLRLDVAMRDTLLVAVVQCRCDLAEVALCQAYLQACASPVAMGCKYVEEIPAAHVLEEEQQVLPRVRGAMEINYVRMPQLPEYGVLFCHSLYRLVPGKLALGDRLQGSIFLSVCHPGQVDMAGATRVDQAHDAMSTAYTPTDDWLRQGVRNLW
mmetsp:Transcript_62148/g.140024  ORF Transcript_62148/g.140024 Transcript_62148/m.140024 type:complete len:245 (+) Transcript_62148:273-1007(+)